MIMRPKYDVFSQTFAKYSGISLFIHAEHTILTIFRSSAANRRSALKLNGVIS
jgi:hypothetical protein